ncbi:hypothetical protein SAMN05443545_1031 [Aidingimonas halophila]|uniref:Uncharacterized protein n=1 Tax=Aidingimonas halophila TaxID=574349 RepID=A0A1H2WRS8_9GAMM|nr:hypothetical protein GCM10008094_18790 [Aidingimonas halophila]SDW83166.1 hypothetical protein SAMN05443545_1031 [Aidingimonas halophila]
MDERHLTKPWRLPSLADRLKSCQRSLTKFNNETIIHAADATDEATARIELEMHGRNWNLS